MKETSVSESLEASLRARGFHVAREVPFWLKRIDVYAWGNGKDSMAIEVKLEKWQRALEQARVYQLCSLFAYVAMPAEYIHRVEHQRFEEAGVGLLCLDGDWDEVIPARASTVFRETFRRMIERSLPRRSEKGRA